MKRILDLEKLVQQTMNRLEQNPQLQFSHFGLERVEYAIEPQRYFPPVCTYKRSERVEETFNELLTEDDIAKKDCFEVIWDPLNEFTYDIAGLGLQIRHELYRHQPDILVFYVRKEKDVIRPNIIIPIASLFDDSYQSLFL
ncbi:MAG: hypothetical protein ACOCUT_00955 [bacterium]